MQDDFGSFCRQRRETLGKGLREFCEEHGLDPGNLSRLETGTFRPARDKKRLLQHAEALGLSPGTRDWGLFFALARGLGGFQTWAQAIALRLLRSEQWSHESLVADLEECLIEFVSPSREELQ